jgi:pectate lyase
VAAGSAQAQSGANLSLGAATDGSSKASGTSYGNVIDGNPGTWWSPSGTTGRVSVKWGSATTVGAVVIREAAGYEGRIGTWQLVNNSSGAVLASGSGAGTIGFTPVALTKLNFEITAASATPAVAEFETYASGDTSTPVPLSVSLSATTSGTSANLSWAVSGGSAASQQIFRDTDSNPSGRVSIASGVTGTGHTDTGLAPGTYYYWVRATDSNGNGYDSNAASVLIASSGGGGGGGTQTACQTLVNDPNVNWRESPVLTTDQAIVACLADSLGGAVGFGYKATGGYNPAGGSRLVVINTSGSTSPEQQILDAISTTDYKWIVFDKRDFAGSTELAMYRLGCSDPSVLTALDNASTAECRDHRVWCANRGVASGDTCENVFFNEKLNNSSLNALKVKMMDSNTTLDGRGSNAYFLFNGFRLGADSNSASTYVTQNVIITNNRFIGAGHVEDHNLDPDMIRSTGESHDIWIHQNTFEHTGDSAYDTKVGAHDITVSFNKLLNVKRAALHGSSDSETVSSKITTTVHDNLYVTTDEHYGESAYNGLRRVPLLRRGQSHMFNNVFYGYRKDLLSIRVGGRIAFEDNMFLNNLVNSKGDGMSYWLANLIRDYSGGSINVVRSYVWGANAACQPQGGPGDLNFAFGATPDMFAGYDDLSKELINANRLPAGADLAKYVLATAGKGGKAPFVSPDTLGVAAIIAAAPSSCQ